jgi:Cysteine-rich secretory protein family/Putative metal-binding motif
MVSVAKGLGRQYVLGLLTMLCSLSLIVIGCGGGGGGDAGAGGPALANGVFMDSPVEGMDYATGSEFGLTGLGGGFNYREGEIITFSIGDVILGQAAGKDMLTPIDLVPGAADETDSTVTNMCRLLQSLDQDGNVQNGIQITAQIRAEVDGRAIDFNLSISQFEKDPAIVGLFETLNTLNLFTADTPRQLIPASVAQNHLRETLNSPDIDGDGYTEGQGDCNDQNAAMNPGAVDICGDGIDQDCSGSDPVCDPLDPDIDGDGYTESQGDCNDDNAAINPGAIDICGDGIDQDCSGEDLTCSSGNSAYETQLLELISTYRTSNALSPLGFDALLNSLAAEHSEYMHANSSMNHDGFYDRAARSGFSYCVENVGWNYATPEAQFEGWRNSSGHNQNMLNTHIGYAGISKVGSFVTFLACGN